MNDRHLTLNGLETVKDALQAIRDKGPMPIIVDKRNADDEYGIVLLVDIATKVLAVDRSPDRVNLYEIMTKPVLSIPPRMDVRYCARLFEHFGLSTAPVIDNDTILGMVDYQGLVINGLLELYS
jgi:Mg/Co/Ni transporter MgtE